MKMWVDDIRPAPPGWVRVQTSEGAIQLLESLTRVGSPWIPFEAISLDHDLGGEDTTRPVVIWMIENNLWPDEVNVHTSNPVGREWLEGMIERYRNA